MGSDDARAVLPALSAMASAAAWTAALLLVLVAPLDAQATGSVAGRVVSIETGEPVEGALVEIDDSALRTLTDEEGLFQFDRVPEGEQVLTVSDYFSGGQTIPIDVPAGGQLSIEIEYRPVPFELGEIIVTGASRVPERVVEAPVAIDVVDRVEARSYASTGQHPLVFKNLTGMDVSANGTHDFNVNARGFNAELSGRMLVLQDGRDLSIPFLGSQEWSAMSIALDDLERIEVVRGPGSALYGANAYNGVINLVTPPVRGSLGTRVSLSSGELQTLGGDVRTAHLFGADESWGVRANAGYFRSDDWHLARTDVGALESEYSSAVDTTEYPVAMPPPGFEVIPLAGQTTGSAPGPAVGSPDPVENFYGSARVDYYSDGGAIGTVEGGAAKATNQLFMTPVGRYQVSHAWRPWARVAWAAESFHVMGWYSGRSSDQVSLASGAPLGEGSRLLHVEAQTNRSFLSDRARATLGGSYRSSYIDSRGTLLAAVDDQRNDSYSAAFAQVEFDLTPSLKLVGATRVDASNLFETQLSPKGALVFTPSAEHSLRVSVGGGFQTPRMINFFLELPLGPPLDLSQVETAMRGAFGSALDGVPDGELFTQSAAVPALALGNRDLDVERIVSYEIGYQGEVSGRFRLTADAFYSVVSNFVSSLLPSANPSYAAWTAPTSVPAGVRPMLEDAIQSALGPGSGLTRLPDGNETTAVVYSYGNAGRATEWGVELAAGVEVTRRLRVDGNYTFFDYRVDEGVPLVPGDFIVPNTPKHKGSFQVRYTDASFDVWSAMTFKSAHDWRSGVFHGRIPPSQQVDAGLGYIFGTRVRVHGTLTNLFDESTYHIYGGSIDRRRILFGVTAYM